MYNPQKMPANERSSLVLPDANANVLDQRLGISRTRLRMSSKEVRILESDKVKANHHSIADISHLLELLITLDDSHSVKDSIKALEDLFLLTKKGELIQTDFIYL